MAVISSGSRAGYSQNALNHWDLREYPKIYVRRFSLNLIRDLIGNQCCDLSRSLDSESILDLVTTRARQFCTHCNSVHTVLYFFGATEQQRITVVKATAHWSIGWSNCSSFIRMNFNASKIANTVESWSTNIRDIFLEWKSWIKSHIQVSYGSRFRQNFGLKVQLGKYEWLFYV